LQVTSMQIEEAKPAYAKPYGSGGCERIISSNEKDDDSL
jgi:hypothetical protein